MRTHVVLLISLLGLLLWASSVQAEDAQTETPQETEDDETTEAAPKKEKTTEIEEEKHVMVLHINNFARALAENKFVLVEFCEYFKHKLSCLYGQF